MASLEEREAYMTMRIRTVAMDSTQAGYLYIVIENSDQAPIGGGVFPTTYKTFEEAKAAAIGKYQDEINRQTQESGDDSAIKDVDVSESKTGLTTLYIEKGIHLYIHRLFVKM